VRLDLDGVRVEGEPQALLDHLLGEKLRHWDKDVRELASRALARLAALDAAWAVAEALPQLLPLVKHADLFTRHGATLAIAELALSLAQTAPGLRLPAALLDAVRNVVVEAEKARVYTGRGGEMVRAAMCRLIECQCLAGHALSRRAALRLLQTVDECLRHPNDAIQAAALEALRALSSHALAAPLATAQAPGTAPRASVAAPALATHVSFTPAEGIAAPTLRRPSMGSLSRMPRAKTFAKDHVTCGL
jgi:hypothetical protein